MYFYWRAQVNWKSKEMTEKKKYSKMEFLDVIEVKVSFTGIMIFGEGDIRGLDSRTLRCRGKIRPRAKSGEKEQLKSVGRESDDSHREATFSSCFVSWNMLIIYTQTRLFRLVFSWISRPKKKKKKIRRTWLFLVIWVNFSFLIIHPSFSLHSLCYYYIINVYYIYAHIDVQSIEFNFICR